MRKLLKNLWANKVIIFFFIGGLILGTWAGKYFTLVYENELMTNWLLKHEINDYVANKIGENVCLEN